MTGGPIHNILGIMSKLSIIISVFSTGNNYEIFFIIHK